MEDTLTLEELHLLIDAARKAEHRQHKFAAALKGIDIDEGRQDEGFDRVKQKVAADLAGKSEEEYVFDLVGIEIQSELN